MFGSLCVLSFEFLSEVYMSILVVKEGVLTTFEDMGRNGFRRFGVNPGGAMDSFAVRLINILLGNEENEAVLEMHFPAPVFKFEEDAFFALGGADFLACLDEVKLENWRIYKARKGNRLSFLQKISGARCYIAVKGGFQTGKWLGSASSNLKVGFGKNLQKGERILFKLSGSQISTSEQFLLSKLSRYKISNSLIPRYSYFPTVRIIPGAEFDKLTAISVENLLKKSFKVSNQSDRMGFRLEGERLYLIDKTEMVSSAVNLGTIQLLPDGQLVILMADHQVSGGYPRIAHVAKVDLPLVAQLNPGDKLYFQMISESEAEDLFITREKEMKYLKWAVKLWCW